jgi:8-oxo-dGTP diphosphatase
VFNEYNRVAVIRAPNGNTLPGGGCDLGESPSNAVVRETLHEAGLPIEVIADLGAADQYVCISEASGWVLEQSSFFLTQRNGAVRRPFVPDHTLIWLDPPAAIGRLHRESHVWAVERAMALRAERRT